MVVVLKTFAHAQSVHFENSEISRVVITLIIPVAEAVGKVINNEAVNGADGNHQRKQRPRVPGGRQQVKKGDPDQQDRHSKQIVVPLVQKCRRQVLAESGLVSLIRRSSFLILQILVPQETYRIANV